MITPTLLFIVGLFSTTLGMPVSDILLGGGIGQLGFALAQGYWLWQMMHDRQTYLLSFALLFVQQLTYALGVYLGWELISGHRQNYEEKYQLQLQLLQKRVNSLKVEKDRLEYDRRIAVKKIAQIDKSARISGGSSVESSDTSENVSGPTAPCIASLDDLSGNVCSHLPKEGAIMAFRATASAGGWSDISTMLRTEMKKQQAQVEGSTVVDLSKRAFGLNPNAMPWRPASSTMLSTAPAPLHAGAG